MSVFNVDKQQLLDNRGNPIVGATIYIGEGNRDPQLHPRIAYADQARTQELGTEFMTDDRGMFPKAYIEPPYSYRVRLANGNQFDEQLYSFGIVEIDYTPGGSGVDAIGLGEYVPGDGVISSGMLDQEVQDLLAQVGINTGDISQSISDTAQGFLDEAQQRALDIQAAIDLAAASDATITTTLASISNQVNTAQGTADSAVTQAAQNLARITDPHGDGSNVGIESVAALTLTIQAGLALNDSDTALALSNASSAQLTADAAVTSSQSALSQLADVAQDGSNVTLQALTSTVFTTESTIATQGATITSLNSRQTATESELLDVYGDGSLIGLSAFATDFATTKAVIEHGTTGLAATYNQAIITESRLDDVYADASATTIEQLAVDFSQLQSDVATGVEGAASVQSVNDVNLRVDGVDQRLDDTLGNGSNQTIEALATSQQTTQANASQAQIDAAAAVSTADAASVRIDNVGDEPAIQAISTSLGLVEAEAGDNSAALLVQASAIANLEGGVGAQWEVKATAADITGEIGLYNDGGTVKVAARANVFEILLPDDSTEPMFSLDGNEATFTLPVVIPSGTIQSQLQSPDYVENTSGMLLDFQNGYAEFQNIKARGDIEASTVYASGLIAAGGVIGIYSGAESSVNTIIPRSLRFNNDTVIDSATEKGVGVSFPVPADIPQNILDDMEIVMKVTVNLVSDIDYYNAAGNNTRFIQTVVRMYDALNSETVILTATPINHLYANGNNREAFWSCQYALPRYIQVELVYPFPVIAGTLYSFQPEFLEQSYNADGYLEFAVNYIDYHKAELELRNKADTANWQVWK